MMPVTARTSAAVAGSVTEGATASSDTTAAWLHSLSPKCKAPAAIHSETS